MRRDHLAELQQAGVDTELLQQHLAGPFRRSFRHQTQRGSFQQWGTCTPIAWNDDGYVHADEIDPGSRLDYHTGCIYPQDAASQLPVMLLAPQPGEIIVDCCAAPGSKTTQIGRLLGDDGVVLAADASASRRQALIENCQRQGLANVVVTPMGVDALARRYPAMADGVLVDAPCSGHTEPVDSGIRRNARRQGKLLHTAAQLVRPGGRLVYSTCTPWLAENEHAVAQFLEQHDDWQVVPAAINGPAPDLFGLGGYRLWPHEHGSEPFFSVVLHRAGDAVAAFPWGDAPPQPEAYVETWPGVADWPSGLSLWLAQGGVVLASAPVMCAALPAEHRGLRLFTTAQPRLHPWSAQALIERGARVQHVAHGDACRLWSGGEAALAPAGFLQTEFGAPLLYASRCGEPAIPSRLCRAGLQ